MRFESSHVSNNLACEGICFKDWKSNDWVLVVFVIFCCIIIIRAYSSIKTLISFVMRRKAQGLPYYINVIKLNLVKWSSYKFDGSTQVNLD